jgi:predicted SAM-dependent methyltransferase/glycosyltransferase involved in cell wall biosynthesis
MKAPITVCIISSDDPHLPNAVASVEPWVERVVVVDPREVSGACDASGRMLDFSAARNASFAKAQTPWVMWLDSDDVVQGSDKLVELCKAPPGTCFLLPYEYAYDHLGRVVTRQYRERLVQGKERMQWLYPVHEVLAAKGPDVRFMQNDDVIIKHQRQYLNKPVEPGRNLRILEAWMKDHPDDVRNTYYYGLELGNNGRVDEAIKQLNRYVGMSGWQDERAMAYYQLARIHEGRREWDLGLEAAFNSLKTVDWFESYYAICRMFHFKQEWARCVHYGNIALSLPPTKTFLFLSDADRHDIHTLLTYAKNQLGDVEGAYEHCKKGLEANPHEPHLVHNAPKLSQALSGSACGVRPVATEKGLPYPESGSQAARPAGFSKLSVVFATGPGCERWDPETMAKGGLGGSETMLIHQARNLAALGHKVTVYADPPREVVHDGVTYKSVRDFRDLACDILVVSRYAQLLDEEHHVDARLRLLWCHDVVAHGATHARLLRADRILALSQWHKQNLVETHGLHPEHVVVTRNGVDLSRFHPDIHVRKPWVVNSSSPDRSWPVLLEEWPKIRAQVPNAELHLFYGFGNWRVVVGNNPDALSYIQRLEDAANRMEGIVYHGRVSQPELADFMLRSRLWAHPTWFTETSCITAMEAKAAGLHIVTSNLAALKETAKGGALIDGEWTSQAYRARFVEECVKALRAGPHGPWDDVSGFDLGSLALEWQTLFTGLLEAKKAHPLVPYMPTKPYRTSGAVTMHDPPSRPAESSQEPGTTSGDSAHLLAAPPATVAEPSQHAPVRGPEEAGTSRVKLNIACGPNIFPHPGWTNYDLFDHHDYIRYVKNPSVPLEGMPAHQRILAEWLRSFTSNTEHMERREIRVHDMTQPFAQYPDNSVDAIYCGQAIEHITLKQAHAFIAECHRMLKKGGILRMTTPDLRELLGARQLASMAKFSGDQPAEYAGMHEDDKLAAMLFGTLGADCRQGHYEGHMWCYSEATLRGLLASEGFEGRWIDFYDDPKRSHSDWLAKEVRDEGLSHSLLVEAVKS